MMTFAQRPARPRRWPRRLIWLCVFVLVFGTVRWYQQRDLVSGQSPLLTATLLDGRSIALSELRGRPVLVHFWATWCPMCKFEQAAIDRLSKDHQVVTVAMRSGDSSTVEHFMVQEGLSFPVIVDDSGELARRFGVRGVPTSFVVDANGRIRFTEVGLTSAWGLRLRLWLAGLLFA